MTQFYEEFFDRLSDPSEDPVRLAAWVEYRIDLTDHFFADGCGKISKAVSAWVLMRAGQQLPTYPEHRSEIFAHAPAVPRESNPVVDEAQLAVWERYYRSLFGAASSAREGTTPAAMYEELPSDDKRVVDRAVEEAQEGDEPQ